MTVGMRVAPRWKGTRVGRIDDLACFVPGEVAETEGDDTGPAAEPVTRMDYLASITYRNPVPASADRVVEASREHKLVGLRVPDVRSGVRVGQRLLPDRRASRSAPSARSSCPRPGRSRTSRVVTPVQYPGQTETEPFARVFVLLDGIDVMITYSPVIDLPAADVRVGTRVRAVWAEAGRRRGRDGRRHDRARGATSSAGRRPANPTSTTPTS